MRASPLAKHAGADHLAAMIDWLANEWDYHMWAVVAVASAVIAAVSIFADWRRNKRKTIGTVGYVPWTGISMLAIGMTLIASALAFKIG